MLTQTDTHFATDARGTEADVCLIVEGCYPFVSGGVSTWLDWLMRTQPSLTFHVVAIVSDEAPRVSRYAPPSNLISLQRLVLHPPVAKRSRGTAASVAESAELANAMLALLKPSGGFDALSHLIRVIRTDGCTPTLTDLKASETSWDAIVKMYQALMPQASFLHFYWAWQALFGGLFSVLLFPLPRARIYHTISTGYAGLLAARAAAETGRPAILTEHGIYTNERRIEILMAEWIADTVQKGIAADERIDLRDLWTKAFESFARACYEACTDITTLYRDNQRLQLALGAEREKLSVIANGIDPARFGRLPVASHDTPPTLALIGRVVPIKDVKSFISAAALLRRQIPDLCALVLGPLDEDPAYADECSELIRELALEDCVRLLGTVNIVDYMPRIHVVVLSSLSEAQPLALLEAGAAGIPCIATDVGACREIIEGSAEEQPRLGPGGYVTGLVAPSEIAAAAKRLLESEDLRRTMGETLRQRVRRYYDSGQASSNYHLLYERRGARTSGARELEGSQQ
ncbi:GT4 family glycosyltransferase PelF [Hyphomicrobium sp.]|uniref:GT4 family glycosyltransferase PelF n=1 Tax=Hyphomicrobium sp. TaxID=82 RepID=UPI002E37B41F|nr:GT4 family glycosyltransferase PelF [Hyphomicrobium sp.]HEX2839978.1 GT4 family glycosyltransferase PelF [Hyphomicrobium sp.]